MDNTAIIQALEFAISETKLGNPSAVISGGYVPISIPIAEKIVNGLKQSTARNQKE